MRKWVLSVLVLTALMFFSCNSMSGGLDGNHVVSVDPNMSGGKIILSENRFKAGDAVRVTVEPNPGRKLDPGSLSYKIGRKYVPIKSNRFFMPSADITVSAVFSYEYDVSLALDTKKVYIGDDEEFQIYPIIHSDKLDVTTLKVLWSTSDKTIADVSEDGVVVGISKGYTSISAMLPDYMLEAVCDVYVTDLDFSIDKDLRIITGWTGSISGDTLEIPAIVDGVKIQGIGEGAFASLSGVTNVVIPPEVSILYDNVFDGSTVENIIFTTESPIGIGNNCFANCPNLESVILSGNYVAFAGSDIFRNSPSLQKVEVPQTQISAYLVTDNWKNYHEYICCSHENRIIVDDVVNGEITVNRYAAAFEEQVIVSTNADPGYSLVDGSLCYVADYETKPITGNTFLMPDSDVSIVAEFVPSPVSLSFVHDSPDGLSHGDPAVTEDHGYITLFVNPDPGWECAKISIPDDGIVDKIDDNTFTFRADDVRSGAVEIFWQKLFYNVEIYSTAINSVSPPVAKVAYNEPIFSSGISAIAREGYEFAGFFAQRDGRGKAYFDANLNIMSNWDRVEDGAIFAHWIPNKYSVTLYDSSDKSSAVSVAYGEVLPPVRIPQKFKHEFLGYFTEEVGGIQYYGKDGAGVRNFDQLGNLSLYAQFAEIDLVSNVELLDFADGASEFTKIQFGDYPTAVMKTPRKSGFALEGYWDNPQFAGESWFSADVGGFIMPKPRLWDKRDGEVKLYPKWKKV